MTGTGALLPESIRAVALLLPPLPSLTRRVAVKVPRLYWCVAVGVVACGEPSPKSQSKLSGSPSGSLLPALSKLTVSGAGPELGLAPITAVGGRLALAL